MGEVIRGFVRLPRIVANREVGQGGHFVLAQHREDRHLRGDVHGRRFVVGFPVRLDSAVALRVELRIERSVAFVQGREVDVAEEGVSQHIRGPLRAQAFVRVLREDRGDELATLGARLGGNQRPVQGVRHDVVHRLLLVSPLERRRARDEVEEHDCDGPPVDGVVVQAPHDDLRTRIQVVADARAQQRAASGQFVLRGSEVQRGGGRGRVRAVLVEVVGEVARVVVVVRVVVLREIRLLVLQGSVCLRVVCREGGGVGGVGAGGHGQQRQRRIAFLEPEGGGQVRGRGTSVRHDSRAVVRVAVGAVGVVRCALEVGFEGGGGRCGGDVFEAVVHAVVQAVVVTVVAAAVVAALRVIAIRTGTVVAVVERRDSRSMTRSGRVGLHGDEADAVDVDRGQSRRSRRSRAVRMVVRTAVVTAAVVSVVVANRVVIGTVGIVVQVVELLQVAVIVFRAA